MRYYHRGQQYSITALTDTSGTITERYAYDAYGGLSVFDGSGATRAATAEGNRYAYTGREWDLELGLYHYRARTYNAVAGRFCSRDPIGYQDGTSLFAYVRQTPTKLIDPYGTEDVAPTQPVVQLEELGSCWNKDYDTIYPQLLGKKPTDQELVEAKKKKFIVGCNKIRGKMRCGFAIGVNFKCECDEQLVQRVESWTKYYDKNNKEVKYAPPISTQPPVFVENFPDWPTGPCDRHSHVGTIPTTTVGPSFQVIATGIQMKCITKRFTVCCGSLDGHKPEIRVKSQDPSRKLLNCSGSSTTYTLRFCYHINGSTDLVVQGVNTPIHVVNGTLQEDNSAIR